MTSNASPLGDYLRARRAELSPEDLGIFSQGRRRVAGLRREEVADLAGISPQYYLRLEQGRDRQPSEQVIGALARALRVEEHGIAYMSRLVAREGGRPASAEVLPRVREDAHRLLQMCEQQAAFIADQNFDIVEANDLARAFSAGEWDAGSNLVVSVFGERLRAGLADWEESARRTVAALRFRADPFDPRLHSLVGGLAMRDTDFRRIWARHEARPAYFQPFRYEMAGLGSLDLLIHTFQIPGTQGWTMTAVGADSTSPAAAAAFAFLASGVASLPHAMNGVSL